MRLKLTTLFFLLATSAHASCYLGGSVGANVSTPTISNGLVDFGISTRAINAAPEVGCDMDIGGNFVVGVLARYNVVPFSSGALATADQFKQSGEASLLAKVGVMVNPSTQLYVVGGVTTAKITINSIGTSDTGSTFGGGIDLKIAKTDWSMFAETDFTTYGVRGVSGNAVRPSDTVFRLGARWHPSLDW